ncbi:MAG: hypothetical protein U9N86_09490 [Bacteroidota bacterium]|nr:hypothetical protein [Bacteroidota bacterium]
MATFLFEDIVFGPVISRRLGASLGINLLPGNRKICNFNCIYCECGWTDETNSEINSWLAVVKKLKPELVMVYTIARDTPLETLSKVSADKLDHIAEEVRKLGIAVTVSY